MAEVSQARMGECANDIRQATVSLIELDSTTMDIRWQHATNIPNGKWHCAYCDAHTGNDRGFTDQGHGNLIRLCPICGAPAFFPNSGPPSPQGLPGEHVQHLPPEVDKLYLEARRAVQNHAYTASVMVCRTLLSHIAVERGANQGEKFAAYVSWLASSGYIPPNGTQWVDYIRDKGNEAIHEIVIIDAKDAARVLQFTAQLLRNVYELPNSLPP